MADSERVALFWRTFAVSALFVLLLSHGPARAEDGIHSRAAIVIDASTGTTLYGLNPTLRLPPASTTKLMTALVTLDRISPSETTIISEHSAAVSPVKIGFHEGERVTIDTLLTAALIRSANDAGFALAEAVGGTEARFVEMMNNKAKTLGLADTHFINATGLPGDGQYITALDLAHLLRHALGNPVIRGIVNSKVGYISTEKKGDLALSNTNKLLSVDDSVLGGKTGYTRKARHCLVFASRRGDSTVIVALLGDKSRGHLWNDAERLSAKGFAILAGAEEPYVYLTSSADEQSIEPAAYKKRVKSGRKAAGTPYKKNRSRSRGNPAKAKSA